MSRFLSAGKSAGRFLFIVFRTTVLFHIFLEPVTHKTGLMCLKFTILFVNSDLSLIVSVSSIAVDEA